MVWVGLCIPWRTVLGMLAALIAVCLIFLGARFHEVYGVRRAVIIQPTAIARYSPSYTGAVVVELREGAIVRMIKQSGEWSYIRAGNSVNGWVPSDSFDAI